MAVFLYKARDPSGSALTGTIEAENPNAVSNSLRALGYQIISVEEHRGLSLLIERLAKGLRRTKPHEAILFTRQLAMMVKAGLPLVDGIHGMLDQPFSPRFKQAAGLLVEDLHGGKSFSEALERHPHLFSRFYVSMVKSGETTGMMDDVLERLAVLGQEELALKGRIRSALAYPCLLVLLSISIVTFLLVAVLPKFVGIFEESGTVLPLPTRILLGISRVLRQGWFVIPIALIALGVMARRYSRTPRGRMRLHQWILRSPIFGKLIHYTILARFCRLMASLLKSGIPVVPALRITADLVSNELMVRAITQIREAVIGGASLAEPFRLSRAFPPTVVQMVAVGERTGTLDQMFFHLGNYYEGEVGQSLSTLTSVLEPVLLLGMGLLVGFIALSVLLPIFQLIKVFKR